MKKFLASRRFAGMMVSIQLILVFILAFISNPKDPTGALLLFILLCLSGLGVAAAGISQLLVKGPQQLFGSCALVMVGSVGFALGVAIQEVISGTADTPYARFLLKYAVDLSMLICALGILHFTTMKVMEKRKSIRAGD